MVESCPSVGLLAGTKRSIGSHTAFCASLSIAAALLFELYPAHGDVSARFRPLPRAAASDPPRAPARSRAQPFPPLAQECLGADRWLRLSRIDGAERQRNGDMRQPMHLPARQPFSTLPACDRARRSYRPWLFRKAGRQDRRWRRPPLEAGRAPSLIAEPHKHTVPEIPGLLAQASRQGAGVPPHLQLVGEHAVHLEGRNTLDCSLLLLERPFRHRGSHGSAFAKAAYTSNRFIGMANSTLINCSREARARSSSSVAHP